MGLDSFLHDLLSSKHVIPSALQIVEDNAKLYDTSTNSCCTTSVYASLVELNSVSTVSSRPKPPSRWKSFDSCDLIESSSHAYPTTFKDDMRWAGGMNAQRPSINLSLAAPQRRGSCSYYQKSPIKPNHSDPIILCQSQASLSKQIETDFNNLSAPHLSLSFDNADDDFDLSDSVLDFSDSRISQRFHRKLPLNQYQKHGETKQQQKPMLFQARDTKRKVPPKLPVRQSSIRALKIT